MDNTLASLAVVAGLSLHQLVFRHGEWDTSSPSIVVCHLLLLLVGSVGAQYGIFQGYSPLLIWKIVGYYLLGLYSSMLVYRGFFHRLRQFPGPLLARLSSFYLMRLSAKNCICMKRCGLCIGNMVTLYAWDCSNFIPFLSGSYACVGRRLALMEIRRITADLLSRFDISFAPGQSEKTFLDGKMDTFTLVAAPLWLGSSKGNKQ